LDLEKFFLFPRFPGDFPFPGYLEHGWLNCSFPWSYLPCQAIIVLSEGHPLSFSPTEFLFSPSSVTRGAIGKCLDAIGPSDPPPSFNMNQVPHLFFSRKRSSFFILRGYFLLFLIPGPSWRIRRMRDSRFNFQPFPLGRAGPI